MRYELRVTAYDALDQVIITATVDGTPELAPHVIERVMVRSVQAQGRGTAEATVWTREALEVLLQAL
jgi:hypothetical protein